MPVSDDELDAIVGAWRAHVQALTIDYDFTKVLKRPLNMYRGWGVSTPAELAGQLLEDVVVMALEGTMGYLYEEVFTRLLPQGNHSMKIPDPYRPLPGHRHIDFFFIRPDASTMYLVNLKAARNTTNGQQNRAIHDSLLAAKEYWEDAGMRGDGPFARAPEEVVGVKAIARGKASLTPKEFGVQAVGDDMWKLFGAGDRLTMRLGDALGRNPIDYQAYKSEFVAKSAELLERYVRLGFTLRDGAIDWDKLLAKFPGP